MNLVQATEERAGLCAKVVQIAMKWSIHEVRSFLDVMEAGSISGAAARTNLSKSVISRHIADFEATLGTALFRRRAGRIMPTRAAEELAARLRPALAEMTRAMESAAFGTAGLRGTLAVSAPMSFGIRYLGPVIAEFACRHPELEMVIDYDDRMVDLVRGGFDLAIRIGQLPDSALIARRLCEDPRVLCASPGYVSQNGSPLTREALCEHTAIGYRHLQFAQLWQFRDETGAAVGLPADGRIHANNGKAMRDMAIAGLGIALLPLFIAHDALRDGRLVRVGGSLRPVPLPISVVWPPVQPMPMKLRAFIDHLVEAFGYQPPWQRPGE